MPMPTKRPRHMITESDELKRGLELAQQRWPECKDDRARLLRNIIEAGVSELDDQLAARSANRIKEISRVAGSMDAWPSDWRESARAEWPE